MSSDALALVLRELDYVWCVPPLDSDAARTDTFEDVVRRHGAAAWDERPPSDRALELQQWMGKTASYLCDRQVKVRHRFRRAFALAPGRLRGHSLEELNVRAVAIEIEQDREQVAMLGERQFRKAADRAELQKFETKYREPDVAVDAWVCLAEAIRLGAETFPVLNVALTRGPELEDPAPFVAVVFDALCPGYARSLDPDGVREAVTAWRADRSGSGKRNSPRNGGSARERRWERLIELLTRKPLLRVTFETANRTWRVLRRGIAIDSPTLQDRLAHRLSRHRGAPMSFAPRTWDETYWVEHLVHAVDLSKPCRLLGDGSLNPEAAPELPPDFVTAAASLLTPAGPVRRGRALQSDAVALRWVVHLADRGIPWSAVRGGRKFERRVQAWARAGFLEPILRLAVEQDLTLEPRAERFRWAHAADPDV